MKGFLEPGEFDHWLEGYLATKKGWVSPFQVWGTKETKPNTPEAARSRAYWDNFYVENASRGLDRELLRETLPDLAPTRMLKNMLGK